MERHQLWQSVKLNRHSLAGQYRQLYGNRRPRLFDPLVPNKLWASDGVGVWNTTNLPTANFQWNTPVVWNDQSVGIEQLVADAIIVPTSGHPVLASWDRPFFYVDDPNAYPSTYGPLWAKQLLRAGLSTMHRRTRTFSWGLPTGGALKSRAIQPMVARPGTLSQASCRVPGPASLEERSPQARRQTLYGRLQTVCSHITPSMAAQPGTPSLCRGFPAGVGLTLHTTLMRRTVTADRVLPNTFYLYYAGQGVFETTNGGATWTKVFSGQISAGSNFNAELSRSPAKPAISSLPADLRVALNRSLKAFINQPMGEQHGPLFPMLLK